VSFLKVPPPGPVLDQWNFVMGATVLLYIVLGPVWGGLTFATVFAWACYEANERKGGGDDDD